MKTYTNKDEHEHRDETIQSIYTKLEQTQQEKELKEGKGKEGKKDEIRRQQNLKGKISHTKEKINK